MSWLSSKLKQFKNWYTTNILHHGEPEDISEQTGMSESDMSKELTDEEWKKFIDTLPENSPITKWLNRYDGKLTYKDKDSPFKTNAWKIMSTILAFLGGNYLGSGASSAISSVDDITSDSSESSRGSNGFFSWLKGLFGDKESFNLTGLVSGLTGIGTELGSSILNYQNQVKLIDKQNEYNTPAAQMQRFRDAGLNPNLVYGLGSNGNQPASGSIAPVDFSTAQRESKMAMLNYKSDLAQKQASINLMDKQAAEADQRALAQQLSNNTFMQSWLMDMNVKAQSLRESANRITNDNRRVDFENAVADAQKALFEYQSQPGFMQKIGSAESFLNMFDSFMTKLGQKIMSNSPWQKSDFYWEDGLLKVTGLRDVDEAIGQWRTK